MTRQWGHEVCQCNRLPAQLGYIEHPHSEIGYYILKRRFSMGVPEIICRRLAGQFITIHCPEVLQHRTNFYFGFTDSTYHVGHWSRGGGYSNYFSTECATWGPNPLRMSKDFFTQKTADYTVFFFEFCANWDPFLRVFLPQKRLIFHFFRNFLWNGDPPLRIFLKKMGPMSKDFCWKSDPFGRHIPVCFNMWVPPRDWSL